MRSQCKKNISSPSLGSLVNPVNDDEERVCQAPGNWMLGDWKSEVENSQVSRQEKVLQATRKLGQKDQTPNKVWREPFRRKETCCILTRVKTHGIHVPSTHGKDLSKFGEEVVNVCNQRNFLNGRIQNECIDMGIVFRFVDESRHPLWAGFLDEFGNLQEHKIREYLECIQHYSKVDKGTFRRNPECRMVGIFITVMDEVDIGRWSSG